MRSQLRHPDPAILKIHISERLKLLGLNARSPVSLYSERLKLKTIESKVEDSRNTKLH